MSGCHTCKHWRRYPERSRSSHGDCLGSWYKGEVPDAELVEASRWDDSCSMHQQKAPPAHEQ